MVGLRKLVLFWEKIKGLGSKSNPKETSVLSLMNQIGVIGGGACLLMACITLIIGMSSIYMAMVSVLGFSLFLVPILNSYNKIKTAKLIIGAFHPSLLSFYVLLSGGSFGEESILIVSLFMIFILYRKQQKIILRLYALAGTSYLSASLYILGYDPIFQIIDNPYDNFIAFIVCAIWLLMIIWLYHEQINKQKSHQDILINELRTKNTRLKKTSEELEQFTYIASHDLKSPLRTIISFLDLIKRDVNRQKYDDLLSKLEFARSGAEQMNFLVTDILEYSKITNGTARKKKMVDLQIIVDKVKFNLTDVIQKKNVDLYIFPLPHFYCNETEMTVLFQNFIENGIKYNEETTPSIFVKSAIDDTHLTLQFIDNGIGIEEEYFEKIFLFFKRLHTGDHYKGTGLGLGLCKKIIDDMQGDVSIESTINVGSTFTVKLPVEPSLNTFSAQNKLVEEYQ